MRRTRAALALSATALALVGCTAAAEPAPGAASDSPATEASEGEQLAPVDAYPDDEFVPFEQVTDEYGTYTRMTVDPESSLLRAGDGEAVQELLAAGATREQLDAAQRTAVTYLVENYLDGTRLDNFAQDEVDWIDEYAADTFGIPLDEAHDSLLYGGLAVTDVAPEPINRTGGQRFQLELQPLEPLAAYDDAGTPDARRWFNVGMVYDATAESTDELVLAAVVRNTGLSEAEVLERFPALADGDPASELLIAGHHWLFVDLDTGKIMRAQGETDIYEVASGLSLYSAEDRLEDRAPTDFLWGGQ